MGSNIKANRKDRMWG